VNFMMSERTDPPEDLIGGGVVVAVVGPSGAGKDSVMNHARERLGDLAKDVSFVRRVITREANRNTEDHDSVDEEKFQRMVAEGAFAAHWFANGLSYGLPVSMDRFVEGGGIVVANVSRAAIVQLRQRYAYVLPVVITAPADVLAERLRKRGREGTEAIAERLKRAEASELAVEGEITIVNDGSLDEASEKFIAALRKARAWSDVADSV